MHLTTVLGLTFLMGSCSSAQSIADGEPVSGHIVYDSLEGCGWLISYIPIREVSEFIQPVNLEPEFQQEGLKIEFTYSLSRAPETCPGIQPVILDSIEKLE